MLSISSYAYFHRSAPDDAPLLVLFHGTGGDEHQLVPLADKILPDAELLSPRGDVSEHGAARFFRRTGEGRYDMDDLARATGKMTAFLKAHIDVLDPPAVIGVGYSNGANILASVIFAEPDLFDAAVLMHPLVPFRPRENIKTKILVTAGQNDPICPVEMTSSLVTNLVRVAASVEVFWHAGGHELRSEEVASARSFLARYRMKVDA